MSIGAVENVALVLVAAVAENGVIGRAGGLPWRLKSDLQHFRALTFGHPVVMGRKTYQSIGRPLPGRTNIVVTRQPHWQAEGAVRAGSLAEALAACADNADAWVIGGAEIYAQALPLARSAVVTEIDADFDGDAFAPEFGPAWVETRREPHTSATGLSFSFVTYQHQNPQDI